MKRVSDRDIVGEPRHRALIREFDIKSVEPRCQDEYVQVPLDLPWKEMEQDVDRAYEEFGWYGMIHRKNTDWNRSRLYGGVGLTHNPNYKYDLPVHAQCLGEPKSTTEISKEEWTRQVDSGDYEKIARQKDTYDDPLGFRVRNPITRYRSLRYLFDEVRLDLFQGRMAEIRPSEMDYKVFEENRELTWHVDEDNEYLSRILVPLVYSDDYYIELKETGTQIRFEPGYAYHWNTKKVHRWGYDWNDDIKNRTCLVLAFSPWMTYDSVRDTWSPNEYCNRVHPTDLVESRLVV